MSRYVITPGVKRISSPFFRDYRRNRKRGGYYQYKNSPQARFKRRGRTARWLAGYSSGRPTIGFPSNQVVKMRYHTSFLNNATNGGAASAYVFRANSIFDPDFIGVGHQPLGHDQWSQFYSTYCVIGSKIRIISARDQNSTGGQFSNAQMGILLSDQSSLPTTNVDTISEQGLSTPTKLGIGNQSAGYVNRLNKKFSAKKFFNINNIKDNQDRIGASFGSNPPSTGDAFFLVYLAVTVPGGNDAYNWDMVATIDYYVLLSDPISLPQS